MPKCQYIKHCLVYDDIDHEDALLDSRRKNKLCKKAREGTYDTVPYLDMPKSADNPCPVFFIYRMYESGLEQISKIIHEEIESRTSDLNLALSKTKDLISKGETKEE